MLVSILVCVESSSRAWLVLVRSSLVGDWLKNLNFLGLLLHQCWFRGSRSGWGSWSSWCGGWLISWGASCWPVFNQSSLWCFSRSFPHMSWGMEVSIVESLMDLLTVVSVSWISLSLSILGVWPSSNFSLLWSCGASSPGVI